MKKQSASRSAFFNPRILIGFVLCSVGLLLAVVGWSKFVTGMVRYEATAQTPGTWTATGSMSTARQGLYGDVTNKRKGPGCGRLRYRQCSIIQCGVVQTQALVHGQQPEA